MWFSSFPVKMLKSRIATVLLSWLVSAFETGKLQDREAWSGGPDVKIGTEYGTEKMGV